MWCLGSLCAVKKRLWEQNCEFSSAVFMSCLVWLSACVPGPAPRVRKWTSWPSGLPQQETRTSLSQHTHTHTHRNTQRTLRSYNVPPSQRNEDGSVGCYLSERLPVSLPGLLSKQHQFLALLVPLVYCVDAGQQAHHQHEGDQAQHGQDGYSQGRQLRGWDGDKKNGNNHREKQLVTCDCRNQLLWCLATSSIRDLCSWMF